MAKNKFDLIRKYGKELSVICEVLEATGIDLNSAKEYYELDVRGFPIEEFYSEGFSYMQIFRLRQAWEADLDYRLFANKKFDEKKMLVLYRALREKVTEVEFNELLKVRGHIQTQNALNRILWERGKYSNEI